MHVVEKERGAFAGLKGGNGAVKGYDWVIVGGWGGGKCCYNTNSLKEARFAISVVTTLTPFLPFSTKKKWPISLHFVEK